MNEDVRTQSSSQLIKKSLDLPLYLDQPHIFNGLFLGPFPILPPSFTEIHLVVLFIILLTNYRTSRQGWKHNLLGRGRIDGKNLDSEKNRSGRKEGKRLWGMCGQKNKQGM